ncbi:hypothetical protein AB0C90_34275 [Streptomyces sp. NPDC048550]|uniref:hypothetical protein n=1 Tax=unclassified Streptomyces TaxID=2593676 RepID=UPI00343000FE
MATGEIGQILIALMVPVVTAAVGAAGLMLQDRRRRRDFLERHKVQVEKAHLEVQFISSWIQARTQLEPATDVPPDVEEWLDRCYRSAEDAGSMAPPAPSPPAMRRLLVLRQLAGLAAKTFRVLYWLSFLCVNLLVIALIVSFFQWLSPGGHGEGEAAALCIFPIGLFALLSAYLRHLSLTYDKNLDLKPDRQWPSSAWPPRSSSDRT